MTIRSLLFIIILLSLSACISFNRDDWPENLPDQELFIQAYQADTVNQALQTEDDYLYWVNRFYNGANLVPGWLGITSGVLERTDKPEYASVKAQMDSLGLRIGKEWARNNQIRLLNTRSASVWRDALLEALNQGELQKYLDILNQDVNDILSEKLDNEEIYFERYYIDEYDDF